MEIGYKNIHLMKDQVVGTGAYGTVFQARIDNLVCAAKSLHPILFRDNDPGKSFIHEKFLSECQIMSRLHHPNIVQYLGTATDPETRLPILLMELMDCNLTAFLEGEEPFPYHLQVNFSHGVAKALAFLHSNQIMHRDVNGNNVLLLGRVQAKLGDFGTSSLLQDRKSRLTQCPGNPVYMPPEAHSNIYSEMLDIFSMGVLLVQIITRLYPNPTNAHRDVGFEKGLRLLVPVPELERRREHINMINSSHPLLPIGNNCLKDKAAQRPSANHLCQQIETLKTAPMYQESLKPRAQERRGEEKSSQRSQQEIEAKVENQQLEHQKLIEQLELKDRQLQEVQHRFTQQQAMQQERKRPIPRPRPQSETVVKKLQKELSASQEANSRLEEAVVQLESRALHLQDQMEQQRSALTGSDGKYTAVLYTPSYVKNAKKEWNAVLALCPKSLAVMTTGLRKLINEMFEAPFTSSSVGVTFDHWNTLTVGIPDDESTKDHRIQFSITPPTIERDEVDLPKTDSETREKRLANDTYPPHMVLSIRPSPHSHSLLRCNLLLRGVETRHDLVLSTPTQTAPLPTQARQPQHITVTGTGINRELENSDMDHRALDEPADLAKLMNLCGSRIPRKWKAIGTQLGIPDGDLEAIDANTKTVGDAIQQIFIKWKEIDTDPSWRNLLKALRTQHVQQYVLAYEIQRQLTTQTVTKI